MHCNVFATNVNTQYTLFWCDFDWIIKFWWSFIDLTSSKWNCQATEKQVDREALKGDTKALRNNEEALKRGTEA